MPNPTEVLSQSFLYDYIARTLSTEYLGEIEKEFENTLACLSGAYRWFESPKIRGQNSCGTIPLMR